jgi:hypothetical protein
MKKSTIIFSAANFVGMIIYLAFVLNARHQAIAEERDYYDVGDSLNYILTVVPVFLVCLVSDIIWGVMALVAIVRRRRYQSALACLIVVASWAIVFPLAKELANLPPNKSNQPTENDPPQSSLATPVAILYRSSGAVVA